MGKLTRQSILAVRTRSVTAGACGSPACDRTAPSGGRTKILIPPGLGSVYICGMAHELDDIRAAANCPACGSPFNVSYRTLRLKRTIECQSCGETIRPEDGTPIAAVQRLIDEQGDES